jgi:DNA-binding MarR family transcriptional regulator
MLDAIIQVDRMVSVTATIVPASQTASTGPADDLVDRIVAEYEPMLARQRRVWARFWQDRAVSKTALHVLWSLDAQGPLSMSRLGAMLDCALPNLTGIVTRMEEHGLVERLRDDADRRVVLVRPTERGNATVAEFGAARREDLRRLVQTLDPGEQRACLKAFRALRRAAERLDANEPAP